jgi:hypothetical protein
MNAETDNYVIDPQFFGTDIHWRLKRILRHDWELWDDRRLVASLKKVRLLRTEYVGSYDGMPVKIVYNRRTDTASFVDSNSGQNVGEISNLALISPFENGEFVSQNGSTFVISFDAKLGYIFSQSDGKILARTRFDNRSTFVASFFTLLDSKHGGVNQWLIALASQLYAIQHAYGSP